jgi:hypothetical protein
VPILLSPVLDLLLAIHISDGQRVNEHLKEEKEENSAAKESVLK